MANKGGRRVGIIERVRCWWLGETPAAPMDDHMREYVRRTDPKNKLCAVCGEPATKFKAYTPWPGTSYAHVSHACDAHESYLHGHSWGRMGDGEYVDHGRPETSCAHCGGKPYGSCGCPSMAIARQAIAWEGQAVVGEVRR